MQAVRSLREWFDSEDWEEGWRRRLKDSVQCVGYGFIVGCGLSSLRFGTNNHENSSIEVWPVLFGCGVGFGLALICLESPPSPLTHRVPQVFDDYRFDSYAAERREPAGDRNTHGDQMRKENRTVEDDHTHESRQTRENRNKRKGNKKKWSYSVYEEPPY